MNPATVGIELMRIEPAETGPAGIELPGIELVGGLGEERQHALPPN
jgi:hypothetical protein